MVKPASRKQAARYMIQNHRLSERAACRLMGISRTGYRYIAKPRDDEAQRSRMKELAAKQTAYGHPLLHALLRNESLVINHKRSYRIYSEENLQAHQETEKATASKGAHRSAVGFKPALVNGFCVGPPG